MSCISTPGSPVQVSLSPNLNRKLPYTWEMIEVYENEPTWVGVNTGMPNRIVKLALEQHLIPGLKDYSQIRSEVAYGSDNKSRIDFLLTGKDSDLPIYVEVKSTTWARGNLSLFPDCVTTRGQKHLRELSRLLPHAQAVMLYFINRSDCCRFAPGDEADPTYGQLLRQAIDLGVTVLPCRFEITPVGIKYIGLAELDF